MALTDSGEQTTRGEDARRPAIDAPEASLNRELSWLSFARRVLALAENPDVPLLERVRFAGIVGMLHDEFFMKRMSGLKRRLKKRPTQPSLDGKLPAEALRCCRAELIEQDEILTRLVQKKLRPALAGSAAHIRDHDELNDDQKLALRDYFQRSVQPILTPLAVDTEHPFPFISNLGLNLAIVLAEKKSSERFVRMKVPGNRPRWVALPDDAGVVPLEQVIAANLELMFPDSTARAVYLFRVTRGAAGEPEQQADLRVEDAELPGSIVDQVTGELKARRFAGVVRLQVQHETPKKLRGWLATQLKVGKDDVYVTDKLLGVRDLTKLDIENCAHLRYPPHVPVAHPRLATLDSREAGAIFDEIRKGDILLHHPYQSFDDSVLRFIESAAVDSNVLAIKLTIYRTSADSPIVRALITAARKGKQVAVGVEITASFDEAPNIAWGQVLEKEGVHVSYGVRKLKTHVKLALVVREEQEGIRRYLHAGTGNYHSGTARLYEDVGILTCDRELCDDAASVFNALTGASRYGEYKKMIVAPVGMRQRFTELIQREAEHARHGRPCGIQAKMNQLQDVEMIRELYRASRAGVRVSLNVRGLSCLRPGVPGLSENIRVFSIVGRFLEHSRIYRFVNGGNPELFIGSADLMKRNLNSRVETVIPVLDETVRQELSDILETYESDNVSAWECGADGVYTRREPADGESRQAAQETFIERAHGRSPSEPRTLPGSGVRSGAA